MDHDVRANQTVRERSGERSRKPDRMICSSGSVKEEKIEQLYDLAQENPLLFWEDLAQRFLSYSRKWKSVGPRDFETSHSSWFSGAHLNACYNCLDRHIEQGRKADTALIWQGEEEDQVEIFTFEELHKKVCTFANVLKSKGVVRGDCVSLYMPMVPELVVAMLACARIGAVHSVVFSGFSSVSLLTRLRDCGSKVLVTADGVNRAGRALPLKANADESMDEYRGIESCIVVRRTTREVKMQPGRDTWYHEELSNKDISSVCECEQMEANDTLFVLYTSGATGQAKGVAHSTAGYLLYAMYTCELIFRPTETDVFWCTADIGWITGHSYSIYGPLGLGVTTLIYEGIPLYPEPDRYWAIVEKFNVNIFYTAPAVIRVLMRFGGAPVDRHDLSSLKLLGSVGEPINPEAWMWYHDNVGKKKLGIADTWWQTETGGVMLSPLTKEPEKRAGSAAMPLPGIQACVVNEDGETVGLHNGGRLVIAAPWPGMFKKIQGRKVVQSPLRRIGNRLFYDTGDGARVDEEGYFWILGRLDDVINVNGHRLGTAEIESALLTHPNVAEAAVVGCPHSIKGQAVYAYVTLTQDAEQTPELLDELESYIRREIGPIALPESIQCVQGLPKTRSGKIMRRVLKKIAADEFDDFGDTTSLADPSVIADLIDGKKQVSRC